MLNRGVLKVSSILLFTLALLMGSVLAPILPNSVGAADKVLLDPDLKNVTSGGGYQDSSIDSVNLGDVVRFRVRVNNISGARLTQVKVNSSLARMGGNVTGWTMTTNVTWPEEGNNVGGQIIPVSVFTTENVFLNYVDNSTKISINGGNPQDASDKNATSPLLTFQGFAVADMDPVSIDPQILLYFDAKAESAPKPGLPINIQFDKEIANVTKGTGFAKTVTAFPGDTIRVRIRVHNGCFDGTCSDFPATNVVIKDEFPFLAATDIVNKAIFTSDEVGPLVSQANLKLTEMQTLQYVVGSTKLVVPTTTDQDLEKLFQNGRQDSIADIGGVSPVLTNEGYKFGTLQFCWEFQRWMVFDVKVKKGQILPAPPAQELPVTGPGLGLLLLAGTIPAGFALRVLRRKI